MSTPECVNCTSSRAVECASTINAAVLGFEQIDAMRANTNIAMVSRNTIISNIAVLLGRSGCLLTQSEIAQKVINSQVAGDKDG